MKKKKQHVDILHCAGLNTHSFLYSVCLIKDGESAGKVPGKVVFKKKKTLGIFFSPVVSAPKEKEGILRGTQSHCMQVPKKKKKSFPGRNVHQRLLNCFLNY